MGEELKKRQANLLLTDWDWRKKFNGRDESLLLYKSFNILWN